MPVISIKSLPAGRKVKTSKILAKVCAETAKTIGYKPRHVWATWEFLEPKNYAVGNKLGKKLTKTTHSPIVRILAFEGAPQSRINKMMTKVAEILARELKIDIGNIFIEYCEARSGKVFDGGKVVYTKGKKRSERSNL